jgi:hypothetical protein
MAHRTGAPTVRVRQCQLGRCLCKSAYRHSAKPFASGEEATSAMVKLRRIRIEHMLSAYHPTTGERTSPIGSFVPTDIGLLHNSVRPAQNSDACSRGRPRQPNSLIAAATGFSIAKKTLRVGCSEDAAATGYALIFSSNAARALVICFT